MGTMNSNQMSKAVGSSISIINSSRSNGKAPGLQLQTPKSSGKKKRFISWRDPIDMILLHKAGLFNSYNCSQVLLHRGADPYSTITNCEWTLIHSAARDSKIKHALHYSLFNGSK